MDFIFGDGTQQKVKPKNNQKQLKTEIIIKQKPKKDKELTPLQKLKLQAKKKIQKEPQLSEFDELQSNQFLRDNQANSVTSKEQYISPNKSLQKALGVSEKGLKFLDKKMIGDRLSDRQNLIYNAQSSDMPQNYLKKVYQNIEPENQFIKSGVNETISNAMKNVGKQIQLSKNQKRIIKIQKKRIPRTKDDLKQLEKLDKFRLIKIKQGQVKNKVGDLRNELQKEYYLNKDKLKFDTSDVVDTNYYSLEHPQTLGAQNMISKLQQKRKTQKKRFLQNQNLKQIQKQRIKQIQDDYEEKFKQQRKQKLRQFYQQKVQQRQQQKQELKKKQQQFKSWIKIYQRQKPLEQKLAQQMVMKMIVPEIQDRHKKLMKIRAEHKPIDIEQINEHEHRYMDYKKDQLIRQKAQIQMKTQKDQFNDEQSSRHYKGKYRYLALESMYEQKNSLDPKQIERSKKQRQLAYSDQVKYYHQSILKRKSEHMDDTRTLIKRVRNHNGSVSVNQASRSRTIQVDKLSDSRRRDVENIDTYAEGIKNLQYVKSHIREKAVQGQFKKPKMQLLQVKQNYNYLQQMRQQRKQKSKTGQDMKNSSILSGKGKNSQLSTANDFQSLKAKVDNLDQRIKRKQFKYKHVKEHQNLMLDTNIQDEYVQAINAKLKLVQELK